MRMVDQLSPSFIFYGHLDFTHLTFLLSSLCMCLLQPLNVYILLYSDIVRSIVSAWTALYCCLWLWQRIPGCIVLEFELGILQYVLCNFGTHHVRVSLGIRIRSCLQCDCVCYLFSALELFLFPVFQCVSRIIYYRHVRIHANIQCIQQHEFARNCRVTIE